MILDIEFLRRYSTPMLTLLSLVFVAPYVGLLPSPLREPLYDRMYGPSEVDDYVSTTAAPPVPGA